ncbi:HAD family hydrolase [Pseudonocardia eucalypti]|uniref:HAD family hydrolase n=1 Tax=Pseudonocardia eucalypti TaxID=648755 RepID=A0ABP9QCZ7_9PSEU|nr:HAD superfamily hydrolase (TIGR01509 family) [Pseudonocardia eucalypti]
MTLRTLLSETPHVLLDFDGPVCAVFSSITSAQATEALASSLRGLGLAVPSELGQSADPFELLYFVAERAPQHSAAAERTLAELELKGVSGAPATPHLSPMLDTLVRSGHTVTIVSNNSARAARAFLDIQGLTHLLRGIIARTDPDPALLKPDVHLLQVAAEELGATPAACVLLGDSVTDMQAAQRFGARSIAFANKPQKLESLRDARPDALVSSLAEVTDALQAA